MQVQSINLHIGNEHHLNFVLKHGGKLEAIPI